MNWRKVHFYLHTLCRYFLATMIISYAFAKILGTQFTTQPSTYDKPVGLLNGFELTWYYYGYSYWYGLLIAGAQIISSLLLFFRKTTRLGVLLFLSFMVNILLVDIAYDIKGAKGMALTLTLMALFVLFSEFPLLYKYFIQEPALYQDQERPNWFNRFRKIKWVYIPLVFVGFFLLINTLKSKYMGLNQFYGTWQNTDTNTNFDRLNFEAANTFKINKQFNNSKTANGKYTFTKDTVVLKAFTKGNSTGIENSENGSVPNQDTTMVVLLKGKYLINNTDLVIQTDTGKMMFKKVFRQ